MAAGVVSFIAHYLTLYSCYASIIAYLARFFCLSAVKAKALSRSPFVKGGAGAIESQATAIVALTASSFEEEKTVILSTGCDDFIRKPFREANIFDVLHKHIGVQFVFEELNATPSFPENEVNVLTKTAFYELPPELVANLQQAISNLDLEQMQTVISQIREINGQGFDTESICFSKGFGLLGMRERADRINAQLTVNSHPGHGTEVIVFVNCQ